MPDGLEGERVDAAVARMLGLSRSASADLIARGQVRLDGSEVAKSDRVPAGSMLEVELDDEERGRPRRPPEVEGVGIVHDDDDIVVVDKPVGVAAHPSVGWSGPDVLAHLAGAGFRISTSGVPERKGIVQRLDVGTSGLMVVAKSERAYTVLKRAFKVPDGRQDLPRAGAGASRPVHRAPSTPPSAGTRAPTTRWPSSQGGRHSVTHYETLDALVGTTLLEVTLETGRTHQIRVHMAAIKHPCVGDPIYGADPVLAARLGLERQWLHAVRLGFVHPATGEVVEFTSPYPAGPAARAGRGRRLLSGRYQTSDRIGRGRRRWSR